MKHLFLILFFTASLFGQDIIIDGHYKGKAVPKMYLYTPVTGTNVLSEGMQILYGGETRAVSVDSAEGVYVVPTRYMVWTVGGVKDSSQGLSKILYLTDEDTTVTYYHSIKWTSANGTPKYAKGADSTFVTLLLAPVNLQAINDINKVTLTWQNVSTKGWGYFKVERSADGIAWDSIASTSYTTLSYKDSASGIDTAYYRVAMKAVHYSDYSLTTTGILVPVSYALTFTPSNVNFGVVDSTDYDSTAVVDTLSTAGNVWAIDNEVGDLSDWPGVYTADGGTISQDATAKYYGAKGLHIIPNGSVANLFVYTNTAAYDTARGSFWIYITSANVGANNFVNLFKLNCGAGTARVTLAAQGNVTTGVLDRWRLTLADGSGTNGYNASITTDQWVHIVYLWVKNASTGGFQMWVNNTLTFDYMNRNTSADQTKDYNIGILSGTGTAPLGMDIYFDAFTVASTNNTLIDSWDESGFLYDTTYVKSGYNDTITTVIVKNTGTVSNTLTGGTVSLPFVDTTSYPITLNIGASDTLTIKGRRHYDQGSYSNNWIIANSGADDTVNTVMQIIYPSLLPPTNINITGNYDSTAFLMTWTKSVSAIAEATIIDTSNNNTDWARADSVNINVELDSLTGFTQGKRLYFRFRTYRLSNYSSWSGVTSYALPSNITGGTEGAGNVFVDGDLVGGNNDGSSWANAYHDFNDINMATVDPGDTIYISGSTSGTHYYYELHLTVAGTVGDTIVITRGISEGHNGKVIFDGRGVVGTSIWSRYGDYIKVDGRDSSMFVMKGFYAGAISFLDYNHCWIKNVSIQMSVDADPDVSLYLYGGYSATQTPMILENIRIYQPAGSYPADGNSDGMQIQGANGLTIKNCFVHLQNSHNTPHSDCLQIYSSKNFTIGNCQFLQVDNGATSSKQCIYITNSGGIIKIRNNYCENTQNTWGTGIGYNDYDNSVPLDSLIITNNTVYQNKNAGWALQVANRAGASNAGKVIIKDNIISTYNGCIGISRSYFSDQSMCDYNIFYKNSGSGQLYFFGTDDQASSVGWGTWIGYGYDVHSYTTDPLLTGYIPGAGSDAIDNGTDLSGLGYSTDIEGITRPQNSVWDIGCYEQ